MNTTTGSRPRANDQSGAARLEFAEAMRLFLTTKVTPAIQQKGRTTLEAALTRPGGLPDSVAGYREVVNGVPAVAAGNRLMRSVQEMVWQTAFETLLQRKTELLAELDRADVSGPGSVEYDRDFRFPPYFTNHEFHLQLGGYAHPLAGYVYHLGGNVFHAGLNEQGQSNRKIIANVPIPTDGQVNRILELACAVGLSSIALKERFPQAELIATDVSAPMVRYAHKRAVDLGLDIRFKQMAAESLDFSDNSFDLVFVHILFHEVPSAVARQVIGEVHRVLRPGGIFAVSDSRDQAHRGSELDQAYSRYHYDWQERNNGERHLVEFSQADLAEAMRAAGFRDVDPNYSANTNVWLPNLTLPLRIGQK